jgi:hypothetical protein
LRHVEEFGRRCAAEIVAVVSIRIKTKAAILMIILTGVSRAAKDPRVRIALLVMMKSVAIENHGGVFRNEHPLVDEVFCRTVGRSHPEGSVNPLDLFRNQRT